MPRSCLQEIRGQCLGSDVTLQSLGPTAFRFVRLRDAPPRTEMNLLPVESWRNLMIVSSGVNPLMAKNRQIRLPDSPTMPFTLAKRGLCRRPVTLRPANEGDSR